MTSGFVLNALATFLSTALTGGIASLSNMQQSILGSNHRAAAQSFAQKGVLVECKADHRGYSNEQLDKLVDVLAYDKGPTAMNVDIMKGKVQQLVATETYTNLKSLLKDCAGFHESNIVGANPTKRGALRARLQRSLIILHDDREGRRFSEVVVMLIGIP